MYLPRSKRNCAAAPRPSPFDAALLVPQTLCRFRPAAARSDRLSAGGVVRLVVQAQRGVARVGRSDLNCGIAVARLGGGPLGEEPEPGDERSLCVDAQSALSGN